MSVDALRQYLDALDRLYKLRRQPGADARAAGKLHTEMAKLREDLTPTERLAADRRGLELNRGYRAWLAEQPQEPAAASGSTAAPRRKALPTTTIPGSEGRVKELERRRRLHMDLFSDGDAGDDPRHGLRPEFVRNGAAKAGRRAGLPTVRETAAGKISTPDAPSRLQKLREAAGLTRKALARRAGLSLRCVALLETGRRRYPRPETLAALADGLGFSVDELLGRRPGRSGV